MNNNVRGLFYTVMSAVIFGGTPILARLAYDGGANGITISFLRAVISLPVLAALMLRDGASPIFPRGRVKNVLLIGIGASLTTILLYASYSYITVGTATSLHFIYPVLVCAVNSLFFKERLNGMTTAAMLIGTLGIFFFLDFRSSAGVAGIILALLSGLTYAGYIVALDKSGGEYPSHFQLPFFNCVIMAVISGGYGLFTGTLSLNMTAQAWVFAVLISLLTSVGALPLFQLGVKLTGGATAAILSTIEPITSVVLGIVILNETLGFSKALGCAGIFISVILVMRAQSRAA